MTYVVAITGGIASGKTTVANLFHEQFSVDIVDADVVAREVVEVGSKGLSEISKHFGAEVLHPDGSLNRPALRERVFSSEQQKSWLNNLLHPMIRQKMQHDLSKITAPYALLVVPLLVENQLQSMADRILLVDVSPEEQIRRTMSRDNVPEHQVKSILASQAAREERLRFADDVIVNDGEHQQLLSEIADLHQLYSELATDSKN
ncbi:dephospho-CoA kinase [Vibrio sp. SCSIO 43137]|uniref:dephospho-CoA kinase n=1 Tax=Vibrio sp. SCSIO 43137 TaxID=3021011 RepID=UPI00230815B7|nr:dephospho-CoA kinase [Vibrio sp. SCSIO 43137]WCE29233.1 dephospho-CoA kinase [Vibrio sp. SCSIO 43137]